MTQLHSTFTLAGSRKQSGKLTVVARFAFAIVVAALLTGAQQSRNEAHQAETASEQLVLARQTQAAGQYNAARDILLEALSKAPNSASLLDQLGSVQQDLGEYLQAERSYLRALSASAKASDEPEGLVILNNLVHFTSRPPNTRTGAQSANSLRSLRQGLLKTSRR